MGRYRVVRGGRFVETDVPGLYAGITTTRVFGRLDCPSGRRALPGHRVFFATWDDAIGAGYRPCRRCRPEPPGHRPEAGRSPDVLPPR